MMCNNNTVLIETENQGKKTLHFLEENWVDDFPKEELSCEESQDKAIFIETVTGISDFLNNCCIPTAKNAGKKVLFLSSRKKCNLVDNAADSEFVDFLTYFEYSFKVDAFDAEEYAITILDECHSFTSDCVYDLNTEHTLREIISQFQNRIYVTPTSQECFKVICANEAEMHGFDPEQYTLPFFKVEKHFNYMKPHFFSKTEDVLNVIKGSTESWLIHIKNEEIIDDIIMRLKKHFPDRCIASIENIDSFDDLTESEYSQRIIITPFHDIHDLTYDNVVIYEDNIVNMQNLIINVKNSSQRKLLNVYFYAPTLEEIESRKFDALEQIHHFERTLNLWGSDYCIEQLSPPFYVRRGALGYSEIFMSMVFLSVSYYDELLDIMIEEDPAAQRFVYAENLLTRFGIYLPPVFLMDITSNN